jgi:pRiA4b ORF-3-like protein
MPKSRSRVKKSTGRKTAGAGRRSRPLPPPGQPQRRRHPRRSEATYFRVKVSLVGSEPEIWRRLDLASDLTLAETHRALQAAFDWYDAHLHQFFTADGSDREYFIDPRMTEREDTAPTSGVRLDEVLSGTGDTLLYEYDFGDSWLHLLQVESELPRPDKTPRARVLGADNAAPPEDCGGIARYQWLLEIRDDAELDDDLAEQTWDLPEDPTEVFVELIDEAVRQAVPQ